MTYELRESQKHTFDSRRVYLRNLHREVKESKARVRENLINYINHINRQTNNLNPGHYQQRIN